MSDEQTTQKNTDAEKVAVKAPVVAPEAVLTSATAVTKDGKPVILRKAPTRGGRSTGGGGSKRNFRSRGPRRERVKPEFDQKIISLRRVTRVMAGGRRFSYSVAIILGDRKGRVALGTGKATDTSLAIQKAVNNARGNMRKLSLTDTNSIPYEVEAKFKSAQITLRPNGGRGLVAGSSARTILEFAGVKDTTGRVLTRSRNKLNNARATMKALEVFSESVDVKPQAPREERKSFNSSRGGSRPAHKVNVHTPSAPVMK